MNAWAKEFMLFIDKIMDEDIKPYVNLYASMDDMEERVNNRLRELSILDFAIFMADFKQAHTDFDKLKKQPQPSVFDPALVVRDEKEGLIDLMGRPVKDKGKIIIKSGDALLERKKRHRRNQI